MDKNNEKKQRDLRVETAIQLGTPDRVPFVPKIAEYPMRAYGISVYDAMIDAGNMEKGYLKFLEDTEPDAVFMDLLYGIPVIDALGPNHLNWPGPSGGLNLEASWQHLDGTFLHSHEFKEFIQDPTHTMLTKILPRKYKKLEGLSKLYLRELYDGFFYNDITVLGDPDVQEALTSLTEAGRAQKKRNEALAKMTGNIEAAGFSTYNQGALVNPFDTFGDAVRGIIQIVMDTIENPEELLEIVNVLTETTATRTIKFYKAMGAKRVFMPLHCGVDEFMSPATYEKFYWPQLKKCMMMVINEGMTPMVFCEGNYTSRLETLCDVPKGKVIYMFEKVDLQKAKDTVGKIACICGCVPTATLAFGKKQQIIDETRRQIDILAPGGGFIMDSSITISNVSRENMDIWKEATVKYGCY